MSAVASVPDATIDGPLADASTAVVHAAIVTWNPVLPALRELLSALVGQVERIMLIDNGSHDVDGIAALLPANASLVRESDNLGVASRYNEAIRSARGSDATHLLLLDQDSVPGAGMVAQLLAALTRLSAAGCRVAVVGPAYRDDKWTTTSSFVQLRGLELKPVDVDGHEEVPVHHLISSGSLFPVAAFDAVGGFREDLFIDYVDIEWCMRAAKQGYGAFGIPAAGMRHALGDRLLPGDMPQATQHTPMRHYYQYRNGTWLLRQGWVGWHWRVVELRRMATKLFLLMRHAPRKRENLRLIASGVFDGLRGRMGRRTS